MLCCVLSKASSKDLEVCCLQSDPQRFLLFTAGLCLGGKLRIRMSQG